MIWVKVCGLMRRQDVDAAVRAGADALGFIAAPGTPRNLSIEAIAALAAGTPATCILVTVDMPASGLVAAVRTSGVDGVQPHGAGAGEAAAAAEAEGLFVLHPVPVSDKLVWPSDLSEASVPLLDTKRSDRHGGTGVPFAWNLARNIDRRFVLAGGLGPDNVAEAVATVRPWGVDASSGLESRVGVKDHNKVNKFVRRARQA